MKPSYVLLGSRDSWKIWMAETRPWNRRHTSQRWCFLSQYSRENLSWGIDQSWQREEGRGEQMDGFYRGGKRTPGLCEGLLMAVRMQPCSFQGRGAAGTPCGHYFCEVLFHLLRKEVKGQWERYFPLLDRISYSFMPKILMNSNHKTEVRLKTLLQAVCFRLV